MKKLLAVLVLLAIVWAIPPVRARVTTAALPLLEKLGPLGTWIVTPARRYAAKHQVTQILRWVANDYNEGRPVPDQRDFQRWLQRRQPDRNVNDPWGNPYWLQRTPGTLMVGSNGPDGRQNTADDVRHSIPF